MHKRYTFLNVINDIFFPGEVEDEVDAYELLQAVDILAMLPKDFFEKIVWFPFKLLSIAFTWIKKIFTRLQRNMGVLSFFTQIYVTQNLSCL